MKPHLPTAAGRTRHSHISQVVLAPVLLLVACVVATRAMAQTGAPTDPAAVVHAVNDAVNRGDPQGVLPFLDPTCRKVVGPHSLNREEQTCGVGPGQWPGSPPYPHVEEANLRTTGPETAEVDITLSGGPLPPTPHPITLHATFTVKNGRITRLLDYVSPQSERELAALAPPPGVPATMPTTGAGTFGVAVGLLVVSLICGVIGVGFRRASSQRRWQRR